MIIDAHVHLGPNPQTKRYDVEECRRDLQEAGADGAVVFAFPEDMYRLVDDPAARCEANAYVLQASGARPELIPFYFVWNDFLIPADLDRYAGIKWHRHADEPRYDYDSPGCAAMLEAINALRLPVTLEEEFAETAAFIARSPELPVIIPHMGLLNGGHRRMEAFLERSTVYFDTAVAELHAIEWVLERVGPERVLFGSDVSGTAQPFFNFPRIELAKLERLGLSDEERRLVWGGNILRLTGRAGRS